MRKSPYLAKERIFGELHPVFVPEAEAEGQGRQDRRRAGAHAERRAKPGAARRWPAKVAAALLDSGTRLRIIVRSLHAPVAQLDRASAFEAEG